MAETFTQKLGNKYPLRRYAPKVISRIDRVQRGESWVESYIKKQGLSIVRGTKNDMGFPQRGLPDYYVPQYNSFIEEKRKLKDRLTPHQLATCVYLEKCGYPVYVATRDTGAIIPLKEYRGLVRWSREHRWEVSQIQSRD